MVTRRPARGMVALAICLAGCSSAASSHGAPSHRPLTGAKVVVSSPSGLTPRPTHSASLPAVGFRSVTVVDDAAPTPPRGPSPYRRDRVLTTDVWYPATRPGSGPVLPGPFPLVVFAHGFDVTPPTYVRLLAQVAAAGYVVAAPRFPISASDLPGAPREDDIANQALDVRATISAMLSASTSAGWLARRLNKHEVAVVGHSDGAETVAANILVAADHDPRITATVIIAGQLPTWGVMDPASVPTLVVQGSADSINPPVLSQHLYARLIRPKWYLDVLGASHLPAVVGTDRRAEAVRSIVVTFLNSALRHDIRAAARLQRLGNQPGVTRLTSDN